MSRVISVSVVSLLALAACQPAPQPRHTAQPEAVVTPTTTLRPALVERAPDTCGAANLQGLIGQPSGNLRTVRVNGTVRVIAPGRLVSQNEYDSGRINAYIDDKGIITKVECG